MLPLPTYLIPDLIGFLVIMPIAVIFYVVYWKLGRRHTDLLFANLMACNAAVCLVLVKMDSVVPVGVKASTLPEAASTTLFWNRILYVMGLIYMGALLHFVLRYCRVQSLTRGRIILLYGIFLLGITIVWSDSFLQKPSEPRSEMASWKAVIPWAPEYGPLVILFGMTLFLVQIYSIWILIRHRKQPADGTTGALTYTSLIIKALIVQFLASVIDVIAGSQGYTGVSMITFSTPITSVLVTTAVVKERINAEHKMRSLDLELTLAKNIQDKLPPKISPVVPGFDLAGWIQAATYVGGDTYDLFKLNDNRLLVTLGDASGHGMGPALVIAETRALSRAVAYRCHRPSEILTAVDRFLSLDMEIGRFVTFFVGLLRPSNATMFWSSAGQGPALFYRHALSEFEELPTSSPPLGLHKIPSMPSIDIRDNEMHFESGDTLILISDGIFEAQNDEGEQFGIAGVKDCLSRCGNISAQEMINQLRIKVDSFTGSREQQDDMTIVVIRKL